MFFTHFIHFQYHESCYNKQEVYHYNKKIGCLTASDFQKQTT